MAQGALSAAVTAYRLRRDGQPVPDQLAAGVEKAQPFFGIFGQAGPRPLPPGRDEHGAVPAEVHEFWAALGMPLYEVWGMSELTGPATAVPHSEHKAPSIGKRSRGRGQAGRDGELLVRAAT